ncbi:hypothetical protein [Thermomonas sp.]|uniref:hypothetical protein n=1 Tax=Thermomonas sp. TaxID=1971895 RepID=UPI003D0B43DE
MPKPRNAKFRARFFRMGEAATRKWLVSAEHHLRRQQEHVRAAKQVLAEFERTSEATEEHAHG